MLSAKRQVALSLVVLLTLLASATTVSAAQKKRKLMQTKDDPYLLFVPGQPLLAAAARGSSVLLLRYPELEVFKTLDTPNDGRTGIRFRASHDGAWLAGYFSKVTLGVPRGAGVVYVWKTETGETALKLEDASMAFEFLPSEHRLVVWQPKLGMTQWALGDGGARQVGQAMASVSSVDSSNDGWLLVDADVKDPKAVVDSAINVSGAGEGMRISADGRHVLVRGACRIGKKSVEICIHRLEDSSLVGSARVITNDVFWSSKRPDESLKRGAALLPIEGYAKFVELLESTKLKDEGPAVGTAYATCQVWGDEHLLCQNAGFVKLQEIPDSAETTMDGFPASRSLWEVHTGDEVGRFINSCAVSADGRWAAVGVDGFTVLLFNTQSLDAMKSFLGSWKQPELVKRFEMP
jgi:hypothetical protein